MEIAILCMDLYISTARNADGVSMRACVLARAKEILAIKIMKLSEDIGNSVD